MENVVLKELINECKKESRQAQKELYNRFSPTIYASCLKYSSNREDAQDILQESFITIFKKINQFNDKGSFEGWCRRIAVNTALMKYRGAKVVNLVHEEQLKDEVIEVEDEDNLSLDMMLEMVQELPDRYRMVFSLYVLDDYSHKEIASMMNITEGTSKSNLARARKHLKDAINQWRDQLNADAG